MIQVGPSFSSLFVLLKNKQTTKQTKKQQKKWRIFFFTKMYQSYEITQGIHYLIRNFHIYRGSWLMAKNMSKTKAFDIFSRKQAMYPYLTYQVWYSVSFMKLGYFMCCKMNKRIKIHVKHGNSILNLCKLEIHHSMFRNCVNHNNIIQKITIQDIWSTKTYV